MAIKIVGIKKCNCKGEIVMRAKFVKLAGIVTFLCAANLSFASNANKAGDLFVLHAPKAFVSQINTNQYQITLTNPKAAYFTDRPARKTSLMPVVQFVDLWKGNRKNSFKNDNPNASIIGSIDLVNKTQMDHNYFVSISNPTYNSKTRTLNLVTEPIKGSMKLKTGNYSYMVLFIDNDCTATHFGPSCG